jgi:hypothetical protein
MKILNLTALLHSLRFANFARLTCLVTVIVLGQTSTSSSQITYDYLDEIPNYILSSNSDFMVNFVIMDGMHKMMAPGLLTNERATYKESVTGKQKIDYTGTIMAPEPLRELEALVTTEFEKLGMHPGAFSYTDLGAGVANFGRAQTIADTSVIPHFYVTIWVNYAAVEYLHNEGELSLSNLETRIKNFIDQGNYNQEYNLYSMYSKKTIEEINGMSGKERKEFIKGAKQKSPKEYSSLQQSFELLQQKIASMPDGYFISTIDKKPYQARYQNSMLANALMYDQNEIVYEWPDEALLKGKKVLVVVRPTRHQTSKQADTRMRKLLSKMTFVEFEVCELERFDECVTSGYDVALMPQGELYNITKKGENNIPQTRVATLYNYVIKDLSTLTVYLGPAHLELENKDREDCVKAFKIFMKKCKQHYGWN